MPTTLDAAFGQSLERIREHSYADQAFRILAWVYLAGPLSPEVLRHALAVEPSHETFERDNLPSSATMLDCCLGLVRIERSVSQRDGDLSRVTLAHSTISTYLDSRPALLEAIIPVLAGSSLAYLLFKRKDRSKILHPLMGGSWRELLRLSKTVDEKLLHLVWQYCLKVNDEVNHKYGPPTKSTMYLEWAQPMPRMSPTDWSAYEFSTLPIVQTLLSYNSPPNFIAHRSHGQSLLHTICMLDIESLNPILQSLRHKVGQLKDDSINSVDCFGMSPLGWTLVPTGHSLKHGEHRTRQSFEAFLYRAQSLMEKVPELKPSIDLWDFGAIESLQKSGLAVPAPDGVVKYFTSSLFLFLLHHNRPGLSETAHYTIANILSHKDINIWTSLRKGSTALVRSAMLSPANGDAAAWDLLVLDNREELVSRRDRDHLDRFKSIEFTSRATWKTNKDDDEEPRIKWEGEVFAALFRPNSPAPNVVSGAWEQDQFRRYAPTWREITISQYNPFHGTSCWSINVPQKALLHVAAAGDSRDIAFYALENCRVDPNILDPDGYSALQLAILLKSRVVAFALVNTPGTNLAVQTADGSSLLHMCLQFDLVFLAAEILQRYPAIVDFWDVSGKTALHYAVRNRSKQFTTLCLSHRADSNLEDRDGDTPLHIAIKNGDAVLCSLLLERPPKRGLSPRNLERAWHLAMDAGANFIKMVVNALQTSPHAPLVQASSLSLSEANRGDSMMQLCLQVGEDSRISEQDFDFMLQFNKRQANTQPSTSNAMVLSSGDPSTVMIDATTTLHDAIAKGAESVARFIWHKSTVNVNYVGECGESLLHLAIIHDSWEIAGLLLEHEDTDTSLLYREEYTPLQLAIVHQKSHIVALLLKCPRVDASVVTKSGKTVLHLAITRNMLNSIPLLLSHPHIQINALDGSGRAAIHYAVAQGTTALVRMLIEQPEVDIGRLSGDGRTALAYAAPCAGEDMISLLQETGKFDVDQVDSYGKTALDWARMNPCQSVVRSLQGVQRS